MQRLFEKLASGQLPLRAEIVSTDGTPASMEIHHASITQDGKTVVVLDDKITLSTNSVSGESTIQASASISIPTSGAQPGTIRTTGNASVRNAAPPVTIALNDSAKKLKATSDRGFFVIARTGFHRIEQVSFFDFLFGKVGQSEEVDESGQKQRPHITIYPDGNGKFIRLSGHDCEIVSEMTYLASEKRIVPEKLYLKSSVCDETAELSFSVSSAGEIILNAIRFGGTDPET